MYLNTLTRICAIAVAGFATLVPATEKAWASPKDDTPPSQAVVVFPADRTLVQLPGWVGPDQIMRIEALQNKTKVVAVHPNEEELVNFVSPRIVNAIVKAAETPKRIQVIRFLSSDMKIDQIVKKISDEKRMMLLPPKPPMGNYAYYRRGAGWSWSGPKLEEMGKFVFMLDLRKNIIVGVEVSKEGRGVVLSGYGVREQIGPWMLEIEKKSVPIPYQSNCFRLFRKEGGVVTQILDLGVVEQISKSDDKKLLRDILNKTVGDVEEGASVKYDSKGDTRREGGESD